MALALSSVSALIYITNEIATEYNQATSKTRALFGIVELLKFNYRYLILIPAIISIALVIKAIRVTKITICDLATLLLGLITIIGLVTSSWRLFT